MPEKFCSLERTIGNDVECPRDETCPFWDQGRSYCVIEHIHAENSLARWLLDIKNKLKPRTKLNWSGRQ